MQQYSELYFKGSSEALHIFVSDLKEYQTNEWKYMKEKIGGCNYLSFTYLGKKLPKAIVSICIDDRYYKQGVLKVGNIVPVEITQLSIKQYNLLLNLFYNDVIIPYSEKNNLITIEGPTTDKFDPLTNISEEALQKLKSFSNLANKSTGSSHPMDRERWFDFICQTVDDNKVFDSYTLSKFLQDEDFWGGKDKNIINGGAWGEEMASKLSDEYESAVEILQYYKKNRGLKNEC